jgi:hypothetical protein
MGVIGGAIDAPFLMPRLRTLRHFVSDLGPDPDGPRRPVQRNPVCITTVGGESTDGWDVATDERGKSREGQPEMGTILCSTISCIHIHT